MYDKQYEVGKVCTLAKIFETICFGVQKATNYIYLFQTKAQIFANKNNKNMKIYQNKLLSLQVHFFEYSLTNLSNIKKMVQDKKIPINLFII